MAFDGWLIKIDGNTIPNKYLKLSSYEVSPNQDQDLDPYRDLSGVLHRNVLEHPVTKIEFQTVMLHERDMQTFDRILGDGKECRIEYWNTRKHTYGSGTFYMAPLTYSIYRVQGSDIIYNPVRISFVEY